MHQSDGRSFVVAVYVVDYRELIAENYLVSTYNKSTQNRCEHMEMVRVDEWNENGNNFIIGILMKFLRDDSIWTDI